MKNLFRPLWLGFYLATLQSLFAVTYYVAPTGDNTASGLTVETPLATPQAAIDRAVPGDTILLRGGIYAGGTGVMRFDAAQHRGSPNAWLTIKAYSGETPVLRWSRATAHYMGIWLTDAAYVEISGLTLEGWMDEITLEEARADAEAQLGSPLFNAGAIQADGRDTRTITRTDANRPHHFRINGNTIRKFPGGGISFIQSDYIHIEGNTIEDTGWYSIWAGSGISIWQSWNLDQSIEGYRIRVIGNRLFGNKTLVEWAAIGALSDGNGIIIDDFRNTQNKSQRGAYTGRTLVANNLCVNNGGSGIHSFLSDRVDIVHNTTYHNGQVLDYGEIFALDSDDVRIVNNICVARPDRAINKQSKASTRVDYRNNLYSGGYVNAAYYANPNLTGEPVFLRPSIDPAIADFRLGAPSPAIDSGLAAPAYPWVGRLTRDLTGAPRKLGAAPDLGAYEFDRAAIPPAGATGRIFTGDTPASADNQPPQVVFSITRSSRTLAPGVPITLTATARDSDGEITRVEFYNRGVMLGTVAAAPYTLDWTPLKGGSTKLYARAYDATGGITTSEPETVAIIQPEIPTAGLIAAWQLDETAGLVAADVSGNKGPLTLTQATWTPAGHLNGALTFKGNPEMAGTFQHPALESLSLSVWLQVAAGGAQNPVLLSLPGFDGTAASGYTVNLRRARDTNDYYGGISFQDGTGGDWQSWGRLETGQWYHLVITFDAASDSPVLTIYVDGIARTDTTNYGNHNDLKPGVIASDPVTQAFLGNRADKTRPLAGNLDQVRLYNLALTPTEVLALHVDDGRKPAR